MTNAVLPKFKESLAQVLLTGTVKAVLIDTANYTYSATHQYLSSVPSNARWGTPQTLVNKSVTGGAFSADPVSFTGLVSAPTLEAVILYLDTGNEATSQLIAYIDQGTNLPTVANQTQVNLTWDTGTNKIFKI